VSTLTPDQQAMLAAWQLHTYAEFVLKDADAALATMTENPSVLLISSGTGGRAGLAGHRFGQLSGRRCPAELNTYPTSDVRRGSPQRTARNGLERCCRRHLKTEVSPAT
jgi:hypothetical protein